MARDKNLTRVERQSVTALPNKDSFILAIIGNYHQTQLLKSTYGFKKILKIRKLENNEDGTICHSEVMQWELWLLYRIVPAIYINGTT